MLYVERALTKTGKETLRLEAANGDSVYLKKEEVPKLLEKILEFGEEFGPSAQSIYDVLYSHLCTRALYLMRNIDQRKDVVIPLVDGSTITGLYSDGKFMTSDFETYHVSHNLLTAKDLLVLISELKKCLK